MITRRTTELNAVLSDWDELKMPDGRFKVFSVGYVGKNGEYRFVKRGIKAGLRFSMKDYDMKAVQPVDKNCEPFGHVTPIWIHSIIFYSGNIEMNLSEEHDRI